MPELDVYRDWLGVKETNRPLDYYQLLRLPRFEDDAAKIRANYRKLNAHVRKYATGDYAQQSQELLNELAKAMLCLTDAGRKERYDESLGRKVQKGSRRSLEQILVGRQAISTEQLDKARKFADAVGLELRDALVQQKLAKPEVVMQAYAESLGLPFVELGDVGVDREMAPRIPALIARQHSCAPVMVDDGQLLMASPNPIVPEVEEELRLRLQMPVRSVLCTPADIHQVISQYYPKEAVGVAPAPMPPPAAKPASTQESSGGLLSRLMPWKRK